VHELSLSQRVLTAGAWRVESAGNPWMRLTVRVKPRDDAPKSWFERFERSHDITGAAHAASRSWTMVHAAWTFWRQDCT